MYLRDFLFNKDAEMFTLDDDDDYLDPWEAASNVLIMATLFINLKDKRQEEAAQQTCPDYNSVQTLPSLLKYYLGDMTVRDFLRAPDKKTSKICNQMYDELSGLVDLFSLSQLIDICEKLKSMYHVARAKVVQLNGHAFRH